MVDIKLFSLAAEKIPDKYLRVNAISKRVRQLQQGAEVLIVPEESEGLSFTEIALKEIGAGKISIVDRKKVTKAKKS